LQRSGRCKRPDQSSSSALRNVRRCAWREFGLRCLRRDPQEAPTLTLYARRLLKCGDSPACWSLGTLAGTQHNCPAVRSAGARMFMRQRIPAPEQFCRWRSQTLAPRFGSPQVETARGHCPRTLPATDGRLRFDLRSAQGKSSALPQRDTQLATPGRPSTGTCNDDAHLCLEALHRRSSEARVRL
jgi:hypothetical protein